MGCCASKDGKREGGKEGGKADKTREGTYQPPPTPGGAKSLPAPGIEDDAFAALGGKGFQHYEMSEPDGGFAYEERDYAYARPKNSTPNVITIMLLGETGSGKSTLVNAIVNHALEVGYDEPQRYRVIKEAATSGDQSVSQTQRVSVYKVWCKAMNATIRILDTPGFGDTRGVEKDHEVAEMLKNAVEQEREIHAVCVVAAASRPRLTPTQHYIISRVLGCFGRDAADGIFVLATFADGKRAPVLDAFKADSTFPFKESNCFHFNNSALYARGHERSVFTKGFWDLGKASMVKFFKALAVTVPFSLHTTADVIQTQRRLTGYIQGVLPQVDMGIARAANLTTLVADVQAKRQLIDETGAYKYSTTVPRVERTAKPPGTYTTQCLKCSYNCHQECTRPDHDKHLCCVMDAAGCCSVCPARCSFAEHKNLDYIFVWKSEEVVREYDAQKLAHLAAKSGLSKSHALLQELSNELNATCHAVRDLLRQVVAAQNRLGTLALRPSDLTLDDHLTLLANEEASARQPGFADRVSILNALRGKSAPPAHLAGVVSMMQP